MPTVPQYDFFLQRWTHKPYDMRWSQFVLGSCVTHRKLIKEEQITVSAYRTTDGRLFYSQPVDPANKPRGRGVKYRIRVKLKPSVLANARLRIAHHQGKAA